MFASEPHPQRALLVSLSLSEAGVTDTMKYMVQECAWATLSSLQDSTILNSFLYLFLMENSTLS